MTRITGLVTGLDVDTIVKQTMQAYQSKIDTQKQKKDVVEIKQQLYRDIIKEAQELYNKHFDILKEGSLIKSSTWQSVKFTSSNPDLLTVTGSSSSKLGNYTIEKESTTAKAASITKTAEELGDRITINGQEFEVTGTTNKEKADNLNKALTKVGINVTVKYTDFAGGTTGNKEAFILESKTLGKDSGFAIGGTKTRISTTQGKDEKGAQITGFTVYDLKNNSVDNKVSIKINDKDFTIDIASKSSNKDIESILNDKLKDIGYTANIDDLGRITLTTISTGSEQPIINNIYIQGDSKEVVFQQGENATVPSAIDITSYINASNERLLINGTLVDLSDKNSLEGKITYIKKLLEEKGISVKVNEDNKVILESAIKGSNSKIEFSKINETEIVTGQDANIIINNGSGTNTYKGNSNTFTLDGVTFKFTGEILSEGISVTSEKDSSKIVENINKYIEDYNSLIVKINTLTSEKRDRNYEPLTDAQKEEMTDKEIELWEAKVKQGQLRRDSDLMRISNALKQGMKSMVSGSGLTLKDIGIESIQDYGGTKDGTFKIDQTKLKEAIESNTENVAKLFTQSTASTTSDAYNQKGIMIRLKEILNNETVSSESILSKKVGFEGTKTVANNTLSKQMESYQKKIDEMKSLLADKEQTLYSKYAKLETIMNNYNSQMTYLSQALGLG